LNVNEYAEKVLFSTDLNEKLRLPPETVEFGFQQVKISAAQLPGRPDSLAMERQDKASRISLPSRPSLVTDRNRGVLLHFFANHELLAVELMALALLKFPDAPEEFRKGLFQTLREEQKHTLWYLARMKECGVTLGEFPVSRFFWDTVSTMETPIDYVSRLSLTFEQANLDYSRHFGAIMKEAGDPGTAKILDKIYRDEISHVGYGLKWFRRWKNREQSDWDAYRKRLNLPLSPSRAKGNGVTFNEVGRIEAGLSEEFVRNLAVFEKSKGRSPDVFYFNPDAEDRIAAGNSPYDPGPKVKALIADLEILQVFLSRQDDVILMRKPPSLSHLERLRGAGFQLPEIEALNEQGNLNPETSLKDRIVRSVKPWSVSPELPPKLEGLNLAPLWKPEWSRMFSKAEQAGCFSKWMAGSTPCSSIDEVRDAITDRESVLKLPVSAAGRGVTFCETPEAALKTAENWLSRHETILVEPSHQRIFDFSVQYQVTPESITKTGLIRQVIDSRGKYRGSISSPKFCKGLPEELSRFLMNVALPGFNETAPMPRALHRWTRQLGYTGPVGVDSYVYRDDNGELAVRLVCEINPRYTMGRVAHEIRKSVCPGNAITLRLQKNHRALESMTPEINEATGRMSGGQLCLNELSRDSHFAVTIEVDKEPANLKLS
jgi:uncharacterized ferritin-like protein (DUF455 family)